MRRIFDWLEETLSLFLGIALVALPFWLLYKILAGIYHLIILLIDKL